MTCVVVGRGARILIVDPRRCGKAESMAALAAAARDRGEIVVTLASVEATRRAPPLRELRKMTAMPAGDDRAWVRMNQPRGARGWR